MITDTITEEARDLIRHMQGEIERLRSQLISAVTNLRMVRDMLDEAASPYVPSSGKDNEWISRRDRVVWNADACLTKTDEQGN